MSSPLAGIDSPKQPAASRHPEPSATTAPPCISAGRPAALRRQIPPRGVTPPRSRQMRHFAVNSMPPARYEIVVQSAGPSVEPGGRCMEIARLGCALRTIRDGSRASRSSRPISCAMPRSCSQMGRSRRKPRSRWRRGRSPRRSPAELEPSRVSAARSPTSPRRGASIAIPHDRAGRRPRPAGGLLAGHWSGRCSPHPVSLAGLPAGDVALLEQPPDRVDLRHLDVSRGDAQLGSCATVVGRDWARPTTSGPIRQSPVGALARSTCVVGVVRANRMVTIRSASSV
jgi:hypothetical protein